MIRLYPLKKKKYKTKKGSHKTICWDMSTSFGYILHLAVSRFFVLFPSYV